MSRQIVAVVISVLAGVAHSADLTKLPTVSGSVVEFTSNPSWTSESNMAWNKFVSDTNEMYRLESRITNAGPDGRLGGGQGGRLGGVCVAITNGPRVALRAEPHRVRRRAQPPLVHARRPVHDEHVG